MATVDSADLLFLDETQTPTTLTPVRARAPRGVRAIGRIPRGHRPHIAWLATLTQDGIGKRVVIPGPIDEVAFDTFIRQVLVPALRPGQVVVLDNLSVHRSPRARAAVEAAGCRLVFLPTYSSDFNPIELAFAKVKTALRRAEARSFDTVVTALGAALATVTAADAHAFFHAAGYRS